MFFPRRVRLPSPGGEPFPARGRRRHAVCIGTPNSMVDRLRSAYRDYPHNFWVLVGSSFIDTIGSTAFRPFFALYITQRFGVGMTEAGLLFAVFALSSFFGNILGGALADRFGRKSIMVFGLVVSALSSLLLGVASTLEAVLILVIFVGVLSDIAGPARQAAG